jgi:hypothetical protein
VSSAAVAIRATIVAGAGDSIGVDSSWGPDTAVRAHGRYLGVDAFGEEIAVKALGGTAVEASGQAVGVKANSTDGIGVQASGATRGVSAYADKPGSQGVYAFGDQAGVVAEGKTGVISHGYAGVGGDFSGTSAPIRLQAATTPGAPQVSSGAHQKGELYVDSNGVLFICKTAGTPGLWVKVGSQ